MPSPETAAQNAQGPAFLQALDHVHPTETGWLAACPHFGCGNLLLIDPDEGHWLFYCDGGHTHDEIVQYLDLHDLRVDTRASVRAWLALRLAKTPDAWAGLILGLPVQPEAIDQLELARQRKARLWL